MNVVGSGNAGGGVAGGHRRPLALMAIGAHAFDVEVMAGPAALHCARRGERAMFVHVTLGERGHPVKPPEQYAVQLQGESRRAADLLGAEYLWMGYKAGAAPVDPGIQARLAALIRRERPDVVVTHWRGSLHPRHASTHENVVAAVRFAGDPTWAGESDGTAGNADGAANPAEPHRVRAVYFGENFEDLDGFVPLVYLDITDVFDRWYEALSCYELFRPEFAVRDTMAGGAARPLPYAEYYRAIARVRGIEAGCALAKAFMPLRRLAESL